MKRVANAKRLVWDILAALAAGAGFLLLVFLWHLPFWLAAGAAVLLYLAFSLIAAPPKFKVGKIAVEDAETFKTLEAIIGDSYEKMAEIEKVESRITDAQIRNKVDKISKTAGKIFAYLEENPEKVKAARRFFSYYLDTTCTILNKYADLSAQGLNSAEINQTLAKVTGILDSINAALKNNCSI